MANNIDFSDLGPSSNTSSKSIDFSDLGPSQNSSQPPASASQQIINQASQQAAPTPSAPDNIFSALNANQNNIISPNALLNIALSQYSPKQVLKEAATSAGKIGSVYNPELMEGPGLGQSVVNALGRIGYGTADTTALQANSINSPSDLVNNVKQNATLNSLLEVPTQTVRAIGGVAELFNPEKFTQNEASQISNHLSDAKVREQAAYQPVMNQYGNMPITDLSNYNKAFDKYGDQLSNRTLEMHNNLIQNPNLSNLQQYQSQLFDDISRRSKLPGRDKITDNEINGLENLRSGANQDLIGALNKANPDAANQYLEGVRIHRDEVMPHYATNDLANISEGRLAPSPSKYVSIMKRAKENGKISSGDIFSNSLDKVENKVNRGDLMQAAVPGVAGSIAGAIGGEMLHPGLGGILGGIGSGLGAGGLYKYYWEPAFIHGAQNPWLVNKLKGMSPFYYGIGRNQLGNSQ